MLCLREGCKASNSHPDRPAGGHRIEHPLSLTSPTPQRLSDVIRETEGVVFKDEEFIAHLQQIRATEDDLPDSNDA